MNRESLVQAAIEVRRNAHAPYSNLPAGAAIECSDGTVFTGCNIENLSYGLTMCAERVAIGAAAAAGHRDFRCIAIVADTDSPISPSGATTRILNHP